MRFTQVHFLIVSGAIYVSMAQSQPAIRTDPSDLGATALRSIQSLQTTITADYELYAPGEIVGMTISIKNPTSQALQVPNPFWPRRAGIDLLEGGTERAKSLGVDYADVSPHPYSNYPPAYTPVIFIKPGEVLSKHIRSDDTIVSGTYILPGASAPLRAGRYRLIYSYDTRAHADFQVEEPILEHFTHSALPEQPVKGAGGREFVLKPQYYGFVLVLGGKHVIFRTVAPWRREAALRTKIGQAWGLDDVERFAPYERIAELDEGVTQLNLDAHGDGTISIRWLDSLGRWRESERYSGRDIKY